MFTFKLNEITFSGGETISVGNADVVIIVGANNCGKSRTFTELQQHLNNHPLRDGLCITQINTTKSGTGDDFLEWCLRYYTIIDSNGESIDLQNGHKERYFESDYDRLKATFEVSQKLESWIHRILKGYLNTSERLRLVLPQRISNWDAPAEQEIAFIVRTPDLQANISKVFRAAFDIDLVLDRRLTGEFSFRVGVAPQYTELNENYTPRYERLIQQEMRPIENEGDGMKSFCACWLATKTGHKKVVFIDEPELFLHPPQATRLGRVLAESAKENGQQIIIATHSSEMIQGIVSGTDNATVVSIVRDGNLNHAYMVGGSELKELWSKPILQSSGAIRGLFHEGIVICESDADVRFYQTLMTRLEGKFQKPTDFYYIHSRGLGEIPALTKSYRKLNIPTAVITDFDVLRDETKVEQILDALGADYSVLKALHQQVKKELSKPPKDYPVQLELTLWEVRAELDEIEKNSEVSGTNIENIRKMLEDKRGWAEPKKYGIEFFKNQKQQRDNCKRLLTEFKQVGFFVVPVGELECWDGNLRSKPDWILDALEKIHADATSFREASDFLEEVADYLWHKKVR